MRLGRPSPRIAARAARGAARSSTLIAVVAILGAGGLGLAAMALDQADVIEGETSPYGSWAPGIAAPVAAMNQLPPASRVPSAVRLQARRLSARTGGDPDIAVRTLRLLRSDVSLDRASIYGFKADAKAVCVLMTGRGVTCPTPSRNPAGVLWFIAGGIPDWASEGGLTIPSAAVGLVADNVLRVTFVEAGKRWPIPIRNNVFFKELPGPQPRGFLEVRFVSGKRARIAVGGARRQ